ncbi:MAG: pyridoxal phosphate-dependent aminotransferase family protein [Verrucomicrobiae bacterium]|nr:pyridoxal phosphate-dependent aminotransferase family protein [Verrucomicrobiae bacterium]
MFPAHTMQGPPGPETVIDGRRYLYFGGTSYLGLARHPEVIEAGCEAIRQYGVHSATSRFLYGTTPPVRAVEKHAAAFFSKEDAFYFSSGYVSNHILVSALVRKADALLIDEATHHSGMEAARLAGIPLKIFRNRDAGDLVRKAAHFRSPLVMCDGVCASTGNIAPIGEYVEVLKAFEDSALLIDDAHGFGVLGEYGRGTLEEAGFWAAVNTGVAEGGVRIFVCGTLSKALGGFGGIIPGSSAFLEEVRTSSDHFSGASAPSSANAGASAKALELVIREPERRSRLRANTIRLRKDLRSLGLPVTDGVTAHFSVSTGDMRYLRGIHESLKSKGILVPFFSKYTGAPREGFLRFAVFADHAQEQLDRLVDELRGIL